MGIAAAEMDQCEPRMAGGPLARPAGTDPSVARVGSVVSLPASASAWQAGRTRGGVAHKSVRVRRNVAHVASPVAIRELRAARLLAPRAPVATKLAQERDGSIRSGRGRVESVATEGELDMPFRPPPGSCSILHPEDYATGINFNKWLDLVRFCDLSRTSPTGFRTQTRLTEFGLTCHPRRVRAHRRVALASIGFVRITCPRSPPRHDQLTPCACGWNADGIARGHFSSLARSTRRRPSRKNNALRAAERREDPTKTLTEDVRWLLRGSISKKADGGCTSSSSGRSSRSA